MSSPFRSKWPQPDTVVSDSYTPQFFDATSPEDRENLDTLVSSGSVTTIRDSLQDQLEELVEVRAPYLRLKGEPLNQLVLAHLDGTPIEFYGNYVFFPWRKELLHILPRDEFIEVRTSRNRYRITPSEQQCLSSMSVGVVGLSVGSATALTLALEGIGGELRIADFDVLSLSNTNRLRSSISNIGVNKAVLCAREIYEINPYLKIKVFPTGLQEKNFETFLSDGGRLNLLIEECDDLPMKVFSREQARRHGIPVIMETSDKGMLDVERFDQEPERPLFHGLMGDMDSQRIRALGPKERIPYQLRIVGTKDSVSPRLLACLFEMGRTTRSWPQLASAISLGAGIAADTARRLLLGDDIPSGRFYVDLSKLVSSGASAVLPDWEVLEPGEMVSQSAATPPVAIPPVPKINLTGPLQRSEAEYIIAHGCLAPSGGNSQAWHFTLHEGRIDCSIPPTYNWTHLDFEGRSLYVAMGAAVQNIVLAARSLGLQADVLPVLRKGSGNVCSINFKRVAPVKDRLFAAIPKRTTNRHQADDEKALSDDKLQALVDTASRWGAKLSIVTREEQKRKVANVIGTVDRIRLLHPGLHEDLGNEIQWTREEAHKTGKGIGIDTLGLDTADRVGAYLMTSWPVMQVLRDLNLGEDLKRMGSGFKCNAFALLTMPEKGLQSYLQGGRAMEEVWLEATLQNIAFCPSSSSPFMFARLEEGGQEIFSDRERQTLQAAREEFLDVFPGADRECEVLLFRLSDAAAPKSRSLRCPLSEVLTICDNELSIRAA
ncbi:UBA/THIF-type NAD/FAD binding protein [Cadophora sp. MPI-SDFR-AT-0126]|nr:UBA/THIF-type NAD/FAD binding protein [Leotiomycetes sp. MPI-SDFR-AT-0126]